MEIEVGEYIRTPYFNIEKVERIDKAEKPIYADTVITNNTAYTMNWLLNNNVKHSFELIDLIEVGDYVNGFEVTFDCKHTEKEQCDGVYHKCIIIKQSINTGLGWKMIDFDIKSIATKEQFKNIENRLE